jgi:3-oxoacyl-ACP reductase-like protein
MSLRPLAAIAALVLMTACASAPPASPTPASTPAATPAAPAPSAAAKPAMPPAPTTDLVVAGRKLANWILANQLDSVVANLGPGANADSTRVELTRLIEEIAINGGSELKVTDEKVVRRNGRYQYWRTAEFERAPGAVLLRIVLTPDGKYGGIGIGLANNAPPVDP